VLSGASQAEAGQAALRTAVSWRPRKELARHEWLLTGRRLGGISRCNQWWLGDWVRYGSEKWGEKYTHAAKITGYDPRSLANMASVSAGFESSRRRDDLTWSHHVAVAGLTRDEQESWLDRAAQESLSVADLRTELRAAYKGRRRADEEGCGQPAGCEGEQAICPWCGSELEPARKSILVGEPTGS